jgi:hypothetical protein
MIYLLDMQSGRKAAARAANKSNLLKGDRLVLSTQAGVTTDQNTGPGTKLSNGLKKRTSLASVYAAAAPRLGPW